MSATRFPISKIALKNPQKLTHKHIQLLELFSPSLPYLFQNREGQVSCLLITKVILVLVIKTQKKRKYKKTIANIIRYAAQRILFDTRIREYLYATYASKGLFADKAEMRKRFRARKKTETDTKSREISATSRGGFGAIDRAKSRSPRRGKYFSLVGKHTKKLWRQGRRSLLTFTLFPVVLNPLHF